MLLSAFGLGFVDYSFYTFIDRILTYFLFLEFLELIIGTVLLNRWGNLK